MTTSLATTADLTKALVAQLLGYESAAGHTLQSALELDYAPPIYVSQVPDGLDAPYLLLRVLNQRTDDRFRNARLMADAEVIVFVRPRSQMQKAELAADVVMLALTRWQETPTTAGVKGLVFGQRATRDTLPMGPAPADREVVMIRVLTSFAAWPQYLTAV